MSNSMTTTSTPLQNIHHLVKRGLLLAVSYDTEVTELSKRYASVFRSGMIIADNLTGTLIDNKRFEVKLPPKTPVSPTAALITDLTPQQAYDNDGDPLDISISKMKAEFKYAYQHLWDNYADSETSLVKADGSFEKIRLYPHPIERPNGSTYTIRLHNDGKQLSYPINKNDGKSKKTYQDKDGTYWKLVDIKPLKVSFNGDQSDNEWITSNAHKMGLPDKFITSQNNIDVLKVAQLVMAYAAYKEDGLKIGEKIDPATGKKSVSMKLSAMMQANTYDKNPLRNLREGVRMLDGSKYDAEKAHVNPEVDAEAALALYYFLRSREPEITRHCEKMSHFEYAKEFIWRGTGTAQQPIHAFTRYRSRHNEPLHFFGMTVNMDELYGAQKNAVILRLDTDLIHYRYQDKTLPQMDAQDWANMMWEQRSDPLALVQFEKINKHPTIIDGEFAFKNGRHKGHRPEDLYARRLWVLENKDLLNTIMEAYEIVRSTMDLPEQVENPRMQDEIYTDIGTADYLFIPDKDNNLVTINKYKGKRASYYNQDGRLIDFESELYSHITDTQNFNRRVTKTYLKLIEPHPVMWTDRHNPHFEFFRDDYITRIKTTNAWLKKHHLPTVPTLDTRLEFDKNGKRTRFKIKDERADLLRKLNDKGMSEWYESSGNEYIDYMCNVMALYALSSKSFPIMDDSPYARIWRKVDGQDVEISFDDYLGYSKKERQDMWRDKTLSVDFTPLPSAPKKFAIYKRLEMHGVLDYFPKDVRTKIQDYLNSDACRDIHGDPGKAPSESRFMTDRLALEEIKKLQKNIQVSTTDNVIAIPYHDGEMGLYDYFGEGADAITFLDTWKDFFEERIRNNPFTHKYKRLQGFDPKTGLGEAYTKYEIFKRSAHILTVPEKHLLSPHSDITIAENYYYLEKPNARLLQQFKENRKQLILRGSESHKLFYAPDALFIDRNIENRNYAYGSHLSRAKDEYAQTGHAFPDFDKAAILVCGHIIPLGNVLPIEPMTPSLKIPSSIYTQMTAPALQGRKNPITAFMVPDYGYPIHRGRVRLREMNKDGFLPDGEETGFEVMATIADTRIITLGKLIRQVEDRSFTDKDADNLGFDSAEHVVTHFLSYFRQFDRPVTDDANTLHYVKLGAISTPNQPQNYVKTNDSRAVIVNSPLFRA